MDWSHWLNDHWAYNFSVDSDADIPLQAIAQKHKGQSYVAAMNWQANESRKAGIQYQAIDIDDGNLRQAYQAYFSQQFFNHHNTQAQRLLLDITEEIKLCKLIILTLYLAIASS